jgi:hypothetical protein
MHGVYCRFSYDEIVARFLMTRGIVLTARRLLTTVPTCLIYTVNDSDVNTVHRQRINICR